MLGLHNDCNGYTEWLEVGLMARKDLGFQTPGVLGWSGDK